MAKNLYVAANHGESGKSVVVLGVMELLSRRVERLGFFRPIIRSRSPRDNDTDLMLSRYGVDQSYDESFGVTSDEALAISNRRGITALLKQILARYKAIEARSDFVVCEGTDFTGVTSALEFDLNAQIANHFGSPLLNVVSGRERSPETIIEAAETTRSALLEDRCAITASVINRVPTSLLPVLREELERSWKHDDPVFLIADEPSLEAPTVGAVAQALGAVPIREEDAQSNREVLQIAVAAMQLPNFLDRISEGKLVITPGDRSDILLGSLATVGSDNFAQIAGVILTGGLRPPESVIRVIEGFRRPLIPVLSVQSDTYETVRDVMAVEGQITAGNERKIHAALGVFESTMDAERLLNRIDVVRSDVVTPAMFEYELIEQARRRRKRIVLPEGEDERILQASERLIKRDVAELVLLGNPHRILASVSELGLDLDKIEIIDPTDNPHLNEFAEIYFEARKHKGVTLDQARDTIQEVSCFGTLMVHSGKADGMVSGAVHTTAQTIRPALQVIRTRPGCSIVSSVFLMCLRDRVLVYGDCAVNPNPTPVQLADIAISSADTARTFGVDPIVAMLSYSTGISGAGEDVQKVKQATELVRQSRPDLRVEGPIQYDAAIDPGVAHTKLPDSNVAGRANVLIFPDLNTGNNTYKAVQRSAGAVAIGPILQGLNRPINDLSRGCTVTDIVNTVAITAIQAQEKDEPS